MCLLFVHKDFEQDYWVFKVKSKKIYTQYVSAIEQTCTCKDFEIRKTFCKHLLFLMSKILKIDIVPDHWYYEIYDSLWSSFFVDILMAEKRNSSDCAICFEEIKETDESIHCIFSCRNMFHEKCLLRWLDKKDSCPCCRYQYIMAEEDTDEEEKDAI